MDKSRQNETPMLTYDSDWSYYEKGNFPDSLNWHPINERCGESVWYMEFGKINGKTRSKWEKDAKDCCSYKLDSYESRRAYEDSVGCIKAAARKTEPKNLADVLAVARVFVDSDTPARAVKIRSGFEILECFLEGGLR